MSSAIDVPTLVTVSHREIISENNVKKYKNISHSQSYVPYLINIPVVWILLID